MVKKSVVINGSKICYWVRNPEIKPTILVIPGFRGNHTDLADFVASFPRKAHVIVVDMPGFGESEPMQQEHSLENYAGLLDDFVSELKLKSFVLWGHSYGGTIALTYAARQPRQLKRLILACPAIPCDSLMSLLSIVYYRMACLLPERVQKAWLSTRLFDWMSKTLMLKNVAPGRLRKLMKYDRARYMRETRPRVITESFLSYLRADIRPLLPRIKVPTVIIAGEADNVIPMSRTLAAVQAIEGATLITIPRQGHLAPVEKPAHVASLTQEFI